MEFEERFDTENLEYRPLTDEEIESIAKVLVSSLNDTENWVFNADKRFIQVKNGELEIPWILRVIRKRIFAEKLKIEITQKAYMLLAIFAVTPAKALFSLHKIGNFFEKNRQKDWLLTAKIFCEELFPLGFPTEEAFEKWWTNQKQITHRGRKPGKRVLLEINKAFYFPEEWKKKESVKI